MLVTKTELDLYQPLPIFNASNSNSNNSPNGIVAVENIYPTAEPRRARKFTYSDIRLLNALYSAREGGDYVWRVTGVLEEFKRMTGKRMSHSSLYSHLDQTRRSRSRAIVLAAPTKSAIEVYKSAGTLALVSPTAQPLSTREISPSQLLEKSREINTSDGMGDLYKGLAVSRNSESSLVQLRDAQMELLGNRMQFQKNTRNWNGMKDTYMLAYMWLNYHLWVERLPEEMRETFIRVYTPAFLFLQQELLKGYNFAQNKLDKKPVFQRVLGILSRVKQH